MKMRWCMAAAAAGMMAMLQTVPVFAAEWKQDEIGWWYQNDDGSYLCDGWNQIDGAWYYFTEAGYCLLDTVTPDGYTVDASGAWVQENNASDFTDQAGMQVPVGALQFTLPSGYMKMEELSSENSGYFVNRSMDVIVGIVSEEIPDVYGYEGLVDAMSEPLLDAAMGIFGTVDEKNVCSFATGTWYRYRYTDTDAMGIPGQFYAYGRIQDAKVEMAVFAGNLAGINMNRIMDENLR